MKKHLKYFLLVFWTAFIFAGSENPATEEDLRCVKIPEEKNPQIFGREKLYAATHIKKIILHLESKRETERGAEKNELVCILKELKTNLMHNLDISLICLQRLVFLTATVVVHPILDKHSKFFSQTTVNRVLCALVETKSGACEQKVLVDEMASLTLAIFSIKFKCSVLEARGMQPCKGVPMLTKDEKSLLGLIRRLYQSFLCMLSLNPSNLYLLALDSIKWHMQE
ncbi:uncharacterized protein NEMAJ01_0468 [Nematocida major]|uniref:uncharacterized protein n=1 Tax=Nematocida major TaxID=1912982 RepID=UPI002007F784|nr:uncharacterized protein NEMAJ01_0468 [Nematocida major]KAH9385572.1 hypothetical protein NEMAJ01_0468 [Nematocida major]